LIHYNHCPTNADGKDDQKAGKPEDLPVAATNCIAKAIQQHYAFGGKAEMIRLKVIYLFFLFPEAVTKKF
jgi:hypothetical protein